MSRTTWLLGLALARACTAPARRRPRPHRLAIARPAPPPCPARARPRRPPRPQPRRPPHRPRGRPRPRPAPLRVELDLPDRTGTIEQLLGELHVHATTGPLVLAGLVRASARPPELAPRYRFDQQPGVALDLRLRRASDRELVQKTLAEQLSLPAGVVLTLSPGLPAFDP